MNSPAQKAAVVFLLLWVMAVPAFAAAPALGTITPSSGTIAPGTPQTFTCKYSDKDGWQNIQEAKLLAAANATVFANTALAYYDQNLNQFFLRDDADSAWLGGFAPGSANLIENSQVKLDCSASSASGSSTTLTVKYNLTFKAAYSGKTYNTYLYVKDDIGGSVNWTKKGTCTVNSAPASGAVTPSSGTGSPDVYYNFAAGYIDNDGWQNLSKTYFLINTSTAKARCFYAYYDQNSNKLYLRNDANKSWLGGFAPGSANVISNSYAGLNCADTTVNGSGATLTINWAVSLKPTFLGAKNIYLSASDDLNASAALTQKGTWTNSAAVLSVSVSPDYWGIGSVDPGVVVTMPEAAKITVVNDGNVAENYSLKLVNPVVWQASQTEAGINTYILNAAFSESPANIVWNEINHALSTSDVLCSTAKFAGDQAGINVAPEQMRTLWLQFKAPTSTAAQNEQTIEVVVTAQPQ